MTEPSERLATRGEGMRNPHFWTDRRVFVTGCTGLLGSWLTDALLARGAWVVGLIRDNVPRSRLVQERTVSRIDVVWGAVEDYLLLERALNEYEIQTVFHLAAQTIVGIANRNPLSTFDTNVRGTWHVLEACRRTETVEQVLVASSDKAYGAHDELPYVEDTPLNGDHPYDVSKSSADLIARTYANTFSVPLCVTRCGNLFGGGDLNFNRIVPGSIRSALRGESPIVRSDGSNTRDYIYVEDAVEAYILLAERMADGPATIGEAFNFSYEQPLRVLEVVQAVLEAVGREDLEPTIHASARNEIRHQYLCARRAREVLGWKPEHEFHKGLTRTVQWYRDFFEGEAHQ